jgi:hypothetical protein
LLEFRVQGGKTDFSQKVVEGNVDFFLERMEKLMGLGKRLHWAILEWQVDRRARGPSLCNENGTVMC